MAPNPPPITLSPTLDAWEQQPDETARKHGQFVTYRDLGRARTLREAAERLQIHPVTVRKAAARFRWRDRVEAWDRHLDRLYEATWVEERRKAAETDAKVLGAVVGKLAQRLGTLHAEQLSSGDFIRLLDVAMRHRRVLFGDPAETIALTGQSGNPLAEQFAEFAAMSPELRRVRLAALAQSVNQRLRAVDGSDDEDDSREQPDPEVGDDQADDDQADGGGDDR